MLIGVCSADTEVGEMVPEQPGKFSGALIGRLKEERRPGPQLSLQSTIEHISLFAGAGRMLKPLEQSTKSSSGVSRGTTHFQDSLGSELSREGEEHELEEYLRTISVHF